MRRLFVRPLGLSLVLVALALVGSALVSPASPLSLAEVGMPMQAAVRPVPRTPAPLAAGCPDNYEPNNDLASAWLLSTNTAYWAAICTADDVDYYAFDVPEGYRLHAYLSWLPTNFDLYLYDSSGNYLGESRNDGTKEEYIDYDAPKGGRFIIRVDGGKVNYDPNNPYQFGMNVYPIPSPTPTPTPTPTRTATRTHTPVCPDPYEPNDSFEGAWPITPGDLSSYICERSDQDYFKFAVALHDTVEVWLLDLPGNYDLYLFGPTHSDEGRSENPGTTNEYILMEDAKFAGDYRVLVSTKNDYSPTSTYKLRVRITRAPTATPTRTPTLPPCNPDPSEPNDTFDTARVIVPGGWTQGLICPPGDRDFFKFAVTANHTIRLELRSLPADYDLYLWSPAGLEVEHSWNSGTSDELIVYRALQTGEYRAEVRPVLGQWHGTDPYDLRPDVFAPTATPTMTPTRTPTATPTRTLTPTPSPTINPRLDLTVAYVEINQAIQTHQESFVYAPIWHKPTVVRVYIRTGLEWPETQCVRHVTARILVRRAVGGAVIRILFPYNPGGEICAPLYREANWYALDYALNFDLPADLLEGTLILEPEVNYDRSVPEMNYDNNRGPIQTVQFRPIAKRLSIAYFGIYYTPDDYSGAIYPTNRIDSAISFLKATWPIRPDYVTYWRAPIAGFVWDVYLDCGYDYWRLLHEVYDFWCDMNPQPDHLVGWLPGDAKLTTGRVVGFGYVGELDDPDHAVWAMDRDAGGIILSHELQHNYGFEHSCESIGGRGFDVLNRVVKLLSNKQVMCETLDAANQWADIYNYGTMYNQWWAPISSGALETPNPASIAPTLYVKASGVITPSEGTAELWPLEVVTRTESVPLPTTGDYCLDFLNSSAVLLAHHCFAPRSLEVGGQGPELKGFFLTLPWPAGTTRVLLKYGPATLAERAASAHAPTVRVISPNGGETWGDTATVTWTAADADGDPLRFSVLYTWDGGQSWTPLGPDVVTTTMTVSTTLLPGGTQSRVKVRVTDGFHSVEDMSDAPFTVPRKPPEAIIESPAEGARYSPTDLITLMGQAQDPEDGVLPGDRLQWYLWTPTGSTYLGSGTLLSAGPLPEGRHTIVINATDSDENVAVAFHTIYVAERGSNLIYLPVIFKK